MRPRVLGACFVIALVGSGCGGSDHALNPQVSAQLDAAVGRITTAVQARDIATTSAQLADLRKSVLVFRSRGDLSDAAATRILNAADVVQSDLGLITPNTTTTTTTTTSPTTTTTTTVPTKPAPPPTTRKRKGKGHGGG
jgi:hypothetical protein